jgi:5-methylcytosine-specific restriction endonuclease McrA
MMRKVSRLSDWQPPTSLSAESPAVHSAGGSYRSGTVARAFTRRRSPEQQQDAGASQSLALSASTGASDSAINSGRLCFPCTMQGRIDTGAHDKHLISHAKETNKLWQNLVRAMDEGFEANAHRWNSPGDAPPTGSGLGLAPRSSSMRSPREPISRTGPRENTEKQI